MTFYAAVDNWNRLEAEELAVDWDRFYFWRRKKE